MCDDDAEILCCTLAGGRVESAERELGAGSWMNVNTSSLLHKWHAVNEVTYCRGDETGRKPISIAASARAPNPDPVTDQTSPNL